MTRFTVSGGMTPMAAMTMVAPRRSTIWMIFPQST
jgi:hypothetical protein